MKSGKNCPPYSLCQEQYLLYAYGFHQDKLQSIYSSKKSGIRNDFFEKQLQSQSTKSLVSKPLRNWNYAVRVENNALLKKLKEIKNKKNNENIKIPNEDNFKTSKMSSLHKKTLNIDQRISSLKKIMKENEFLEKRLQTVPSTIDVKKIQNLYQENIKHSENISKFSRRTLNSFLNNKTSTNFYATQKTLRIKKNKKRPSAGAAEPQTENIQNNANAIIIDDNNTKIERKDSMSIKTNEKNTENITPKNQINENNNENPSLVSGTIEESKTLEENMKKNIDNKQSGLLISENIEVGKATENTDDLKNNLGNINIEKSVNLQ